ncbi:PREDICTED: venom serine protease-like [Wasmannia auropunctata]|uniref:venom serine protease-like n=1 Tax=Wasmannia auropunctata TaxID=64793 RepID=UPI0005EDFAAE|nr:PREDICTED: venom serine protease-like [Wasmannia auropunctata]
MELCWKFLLEFYGYIEFKVVLFGLLLFLPMLNGVDPKCNYSGNLKAGEKCYVHNPEFPNYYKGENHYVWKLASDNVIKINCSLQTGNDCNQDRLSVKFSEDNRLYYCGFDTFVYEGKNPIIRLDSLIESQGGRFICEVQALKDNLNKCQCGWKKVTRIVGGKETEINEYPMMGGLFDLKNPQLIYCGATIISNIHIMTAAHCIVNKDPSEFAVIFGEHDISTDSETKSSHVFYIIGCVIPPDYNSNPGNNSNLIINNDVAVCEVHGYIEYSAEVGSVCLPFQHKNDSFDDSIVTALGWGLTEYAGRESKTLQKVDLNIISLQKCRSYYSDVSDRNMCTFTPGKDTCQMDGGGPLLWQNPTTNNIFLIGIISASSNCVSDMPSVETRVGVFLDWILIVTPGLGYCSVE